MQDDAAGVIMEGRAGQKGPSSSSSPPSLDAAGGGAALFSSLDVFPELRLLSLPATRGSHAAAVRAELVTPGSMAVVRSFFPPPSAATAAAGTRIVVLGNPGLPYLRRLLVLEALNVEQLILVDRSMGMLAATVKELGATLRSKVCCLRSDEPFILQHVLAEESCDLILTATPRPYPGPSNAYRLLTRDIFTLVHQCLRTRTSPSAAMGFVAWTPSPSYFAFAVAQLEESKLVVPWARKDPAVFADWVPQKQEQQQQQQQGTMLTLCVAKTSKTSALAQQLNAQYSYARRKYVAF